MLNEWFGQRGVFWVAKTSSSPKGTEMLCFNENYEHFKFSVNRIYLPSPGKLRHLSSPSKGEVLRVSRPHWARHFICLLSLTYWGKVSASEKLITNNNISRQLHVSLMFTDDNAWIYMRRKPFSLSKKRKTVSSLKLRRRKRSEIIKRHNQTS